MADENQFQETSDRIEKKAQLYLHAHSVYDDNSSQLLKKILYRKIDDYETDCGCSALAETGIDLLCGKSRKFFQKQRNLDSKVRKFRDLVLLVDKLSCEQKCQMFDMLRHKPIDDLFEFLESFEEKPPEAITIDASNLNLIPESGRIYLGSVKLR